MRSIKRILIAYDGSDCADAALDDLTHAGFPPNATAKIFSVAEVWLPPPPPSVWQMLERVGKAKSPAELQRSYAKECPGTKAALAGAQRARDRIKANFPGWKVTLDATCGSPASEILAKAQEWKPDLIVVGSHGRTAVGRLVLGSVSQRVLTEAPCSVRVARGHVDESNEPVRIIIGIDGSPFSEQAVNEVAHRKWPAKTEVKLMVVDDPLVPNYVGDLIPPLRKILTDDKNEQKRWSKKITDKAVKRLRDSNVKVISVLREGEPKQELPKAAEEWGADCIFVGSAGFSNRIERLILGSVSAAVAARAHCSVEVIRNKSKKQ